MYRVHRPNGRALEPLAGACRPAARWISHPVHGEKASFVPVGPLLPSLAWGPLYIYIYFFCRMPFATLRKISVVTIQRTDVRSCNNCVFVLYFFCSTLALFVRDIMFKWDSCAAGDIKRAVSESILAIS